MGGQGLVARSPRPSWTPRTRHEEPARGFRAGGVGTSLGRFVMATERKVAVITGASQGIGAGLVRGFLDRGYRVVANSRSIAPDPSEDVLAVPGDIADTAVADHVIGEAVAKFGRVDTLVNNAGLFVAKPFTEYTADDYAKV